MKYIKLKKLSLFSLPILILIFGFLSFLYFTNPVSAIDYGGLGVVPGNPDPSNPRTKSIFIYTIKPSDTKNDEIVVTNNTNDKKTITIYSADTTKSSEGAFACKQLAEPKTDVGNWIKLSKSEITLESMQKERVPFTVSVPNNASVGEHNGCILIQEKKDDTNQGGVGLSFRSGLRVAITVPGIQSKKLDITKFDLNTNDKGNYEARVEVKNSGTVSVDADVKVIVKYFFGINQNTISNQFPVLRDETGGYTFEFNPPFWGGWYSVTAVVSYDPDPNTPLGVDSGQPKVQLYSDDKSFFSSPQPTALIIELAVISLLILLIVILLVKISKKRKIKKTWVTYSVRSGDNLRNIAGRYDVSWKLLARINNLKPPFELDSGDIIKVPPFKK